MIIELKYRPTDRYAGAVLALACGDALGAPAEFLSKEQLASRHGHLTEMVGGGGCQWRPGEWTDDTGMTLCVAEGILECPEDPVAAIGERFLDWLETTKDAGGTITSALLGFQERTASSATERLAANDLWAEASSNTPESLSGRAAGNGSLMRTLPVALAYPDRDSMLNTSARISAMTHWDPQAELACAIYCMWIRNMLRGLPMGDAWVKALEQGRDVQAEGRRDANTPGPDPVPDKFWRRLETALERPERDLQPHEHYAGYVLDCLEAVVWCCHQHEATDEVLIRTVNLAGEADTMAAIGGGVMGVANGLDGLRDDWLAVLHERQKLETVGRKVAKLRSEQVYSKPNLPPFTGYEAWPGLHAGRNPLTDIDVEQMIASGIRLIIDLREEKEWASERLLGAEAVAAQIWCGLDRYHLPIPDGQAPNPEALDQLWSILRTEARESPGDVYLHCRAGIERTGSAIAAYVARSEGMSYDQTLRLFEANDVPVVPLPHQREAVKHWLESVCE
jgi:ADP-ribosyl-[dinitrogen reductase] hydrolase